MRRYIWEESAWPEVSVNAAALEAEFNRGVGVALAADSHGTKKLLRRARTRAARIARHDAVGFVVSTITIGNALFFSVIYRLLSRVGSTRASTRSSQSFLRYGAARYRRSRRPKDTRAERIARPAHELPSHRHLRSADSPRSGAAERRSTLSVIALAAQPQRRRAAWLDSVPHPMCERCLPRTTSSSANR